MSEELNKNAIKAIHERYNCQGKYPCSEFDYCKFGNGFSNSFDFCECGADEFYEGYVRAVKENEDSK